MSKQHFRTLLNRYRSNECSPQERRLVEQWFSLLDGEPSVRDARQTQQLEEKIWRAIQEKQAESKQFVRPHPAKYRWWQSAAAALLVFGLSWFVYDSFDGSSKNTLTTNTETTSPPQSQERTNEGTTDLEIKLSDGSRITLSPGGSIQYPAQFASTRREVSLSGEAFFDVTRNPQQPFFVNTGEITTKVLGTSFRVQTGQADNTVRVSVLTGKVSVFQRDESQSEKIKNGVILTPNQRVVYTPASRVFVTSLVENPLPVVADVPTATPPPPTKFIFEDATMETVVSRLEAAYGIEIILENEELKNCLFTADITEQPLFTKLDLLCASLNSTYEVRGTKILIMGKGCG